MTTSLYRLVRTKRYETEDTDVVLALNERVK
jgi:hypothetical protein